VAKLVSTLDPQVAMAACLHANQLRLDPRDPVDRVVEQLNAVCKAATLEFALAVGKLIIDSFYSGSLLSWRDRGPKNCSFRKLANHPLLVLSPGSLYRSVAIFELCERLGVRDWRRVSATHLRLVLALPPQQQEDLLLKVEAHDWPARRLEREVAGLAPKRLRGGAKRRSCLRATISELSKCIDDQSSLVGASEAEVEMCTESARHYLDVLRRMRQACEALQRRLEAQLPGARTAPPPAYDEPAAHDVGPAEKL
jgi:hypothetical protein